MSFVFRLAAASLCLAFSALAALAFETTARAAYVLDQGTGIELLTKNADEPLPPASMSKLMTLYMLFDALRDGRIGMDTEFSVSTRARNMTGSTMFLNEQDRPTAADLIQGIIVSSGNDATVVVAEGLAGTEAAFAQQMTKMAQQLGMTRSTFANASGWPAANHRMSVRDLGILAARLIEEFPEYYGYFSQTEFDYRNRSPANRFNRNPLLGLGIGADGLKTGHTTEAGFGLVGSARQGDRRVIVVISGLDSSQQRSAEAEALVNWSFRQFAEKTVAKAGAPIIEAAVWGGGQPTVGLESASDLKILLPALTEAEIAAEVVYSGPLRAPLAKGQELAQLVIRPEGLPEIRHPLVAARDVPVGGFGARVMSAANALLTRLANGPEGAM